VLFASLVLHWLTINTLQVLTYFLDRQDPTPRGTLFVESCTIEVPPDDSAKKAKVAGVKAPPGQVRHGRLLVFFINCCRLLSIWLSNTISSFTSLREYVSNAIFRVSRLFAGERSGVLSFLHQP